MPPLDDAVASADDPKAASQTFALVTMCARCLMLGAIVSSAAWMLVSFVFDRIGYGLH